MLAGRRGSLSHHFPAYHGGRQADRADDHSCCGMRDARRAAASLGPRREAAEAVARQERQKPQPRKMT